MDKVETYDKIDKIYATEKCNSYSLSGRLVQNFSAHFVINK